MVLPTTRSVPAKEEAEKLKPLLVGLVCKTILLLPETLAVKLT